jgi:glutaminyl-peptide cyclotransferase
MNAVTRLGLVAVALWWAGCGPSPHTEIRPQLFDGNRAYRHVERLVNYGPRPPSSVALGTAAVYIAAQLQEFGLEAQEQVFRAQTPRGVMQFRNVVGRTKGRGGPGQVILLGAHYDTKILPQFQFVGANDSGSGVGVLLEIARVAGNQPNLWFVFLDGEEAMVDYGPQDGLWGSRFFVEDLKGTDRVNWIKAFILLDMVGDANLNVTVPRNSTPALTQLVFDAARDTGHRDRFAYHNGPITDDHVPFLEAGIPALDLIDFEYGSAPGLNDYWHTAEDRLDKLSPRSLAAVGQTTLRLISLLQKTPTLR